MTHDLVGLLTLNVYFLLAGLGVLWGVRGWCTWGELVPLVGVAYIIGVATVNVAATLVLVAGGGLSTGAILLLMLLVGLAGVGGGVVQRRPLPRTLGPVWRPRTSLDLIAVALALLTLALLVAFYRVARNQPLVAWDAWSFWIPKAKAIYYFNGLDPQLFKSLSAPSYPLLVPSLDAMNFRFMGATDTTTLNVQYWLLFAGFLLAAAGLLRRLAPAALIWLFLATAVVIPEVNHRLLQLIADWPLDIFFAFAALCLVRWLETGERWPLVLYGIGMAATIATKREGQLLAAALVLGGLAATARRPRQAWLPILTPAALGYAINIPWRIWWTSRHLASDTPDGGLGNFNAWGRIWPGLHLVLRLLFNYDLWLLPVPLALAAALLGARQSHMELSVLYLVTTVLGILGFAWVIWSGPNLPITTNPALTPIPRAVASIVLLSTVLGPVFIARMIEPEAAREASPAAVAAAPAAGLSDAGVA